MTDPLPQHAQRTLPVALAIAVLMQVPTVHAEEVQVGRYATVRAVPTRAQINLLAAPVRVQFPEAVDTVGKAVEHLLRPSGYRLAAEAVADPARAVLLGLPLPAVHRSLGPMPLQSALETLAGPAYRLVEDPAHRLVSFERCAYSRPLKTPTSTNGEK